MTKKLFTLAIEDRRVRIIDNNTNKVVGTIRGDSPRFVGTDGRHAMVWFRDGQLRGYDLLSKRTLWDIDIKGVVSISVIGKVGTIGLRGRPWFRLSMLTGEKLTDETALELKLRAYLEETKIEGLGDAA